MGSLYNSDANAAITQAFNPDTGAIKIEGGAAGSGAGTEYVEDVASVGGEQGPLIMGLRQDADVSPVSNNGDFHPFTFNEVGRLKTASAPAQYTAATGNITGGNVLTGGLISAVATITGGNLATGGTASAAGNVTGGNLKATGNIFIGDTVFTRTLVVGTRTTPVTVALASNNSFLVGTRSSGNITVFTT